jgi:hypothetical protein
VKRAKTRRADVADEAYNCCEGSALTSAMWFGVFGMRRLSLGDHMRTNASTRHAVGECRADVVRKTLTRC